MWQAEQAVAQTPNVFSTKQLALLLRENSYSKQAKPGKPLLLSTVTDFNIALYNYVLTLEKTSIWDHPSLLVPLPISASLQWSSK